MNGTCCGCSAKRPSSTDWRRPLSPAGRGVRSTPRCGTWGRPGLSSPSPTRRQCRHLTKPLSRYGAAGAPRVDLRGCLRAQQGGDLLELLAGDDGREGALNAHWRQPVLRGDAPEQGSRVGLVGEHLVDGRLVPALARWAGDAFGVQGLADVEYAPVLQGHLAVAFPGGLPRATRSLRRSSRALVAWPRAAAATECAMRAALADWDETGSGPPRRAAQPHHRAGLAAPPATDRWRA